tara:strand:+ start:140 stop:466 length:327 start_codon:yes stop_codon:yes gene_type:complete
MTPNQFIRILDNPMWDYSKKYEEKDDTDGCTYYRYNNSLFSNPSMFMIGTKHKSRGNGDMRKLMKHVIGLFDYIATTIECNDTKRMKSFLIELGFTYDCRYHIWEIVE